MLALNCCGLMAQVVVVVVVVCGDTVYWRLNTGLPITVYRDDAIVKSLSFIRFSRRPTIISSQKTIFSPSTTTMAAETTSFDASGFSAVGSFFGKTSGEEASKTPTAKKSHLGVGATSKALPQQHDSTQSKVMKIGKRTRQEEEEDDEDDEVEQDDEEEEEEGRTTIEDKQPKVNISSEPEKPKKKKKKGKKERQQEAATSTNEAIEPEPAVDEKPAVEEEPVEDPSSGPKRKRRKIRSKQKNIYKDTRTMDQKPQHLRLGSQEFEGRPLTAETRDKLSLPAPKERRRPQIRTSTMKDEGGLAIDDLLSDEHDDVGETNIEQKKSKKKTKARRKPKYKNLG